MNKKIILMFLICCAAFFSCNSSETNSASITKQEKIANVNSINYTEKTKAFLKWYKSKFYEILQIQFVDLIEDGNTSQYRVNFNNADKYLAILKSSGYFSYEFLETMKKYFESGDKKLVELRQNDGPPTGFEHDLLLFTQEPESLLENIDKVKYEIVQETESYTIVKVDNDLLFMYDKTGLIESISK